MKIKLLAATGFLTVFALATPGKAENPTHVKQLLTTRECPGCDLQGANLKDAHLIGADLRDANLIGANLSGANLEGADLTNAKLENANLTASFLTNASLNQADLDRANLTAATIIDADVSGASMLLSLLGEVGYLLSATNLGGWSRVVSEADLLLLLAPLYYVGVSLWVSRQRLPLSQLPAFRVVQGLGMIAAAYLLLSWILRISSQSQNRTLQRCTSKELTI